MASPALNNALSNTYTSSLKMLLIRLGISANPPNADTVPPAISPTNFAAALPTRSIVG